MFLFLVALIAAAAASVDDIRITSALMSPQALQVGSRCNVGFPFNNKSCDFYFLSRSGSRGLVHFNKKRLTLNMVNSFQI